MTTQISIERAPFTALLKVYPSVAPSTLYRLANREESAVAFGNLKEAEYRIKLNDAYRFIASVELSSGGLAWNHALQATIGAKPVHSADEVFVAGERGAAWDQSWFKPEEWPAHVVEDLTQYQARIDAERLKLLDDKQKLSGFAWYGKVIRPDQTQQLFDENTNFVSIIPMRSILSHWRLFLAELGARYA
jgi:hypothetical protein